MQWCSFILLDADLNLGCPQSHAKDGHYGAYLLGQKDWPLVASIVSSLSQSLTVPVSAKIRLCSPSSQTLQFAHLLEAAGASWITLHARHVSVRRRRQGAAFLDEVAKLQTGSEAVPGVSIPVISNGNVRYWEDIPRNLEQTGADGVMVGETLLGNPCLFDKTGRIPDPILISLEYLDLCRQHPETVTLDQIQAHVKHLVEFQCSRSPWYQKFRGYLSRSASIDEIDRLLRRKVQRWRGLSLLDDNEQPDDDEDDEIEEGVGSSVEVTLDGWI